MLDLGALDTATDRQLLIRLVALLTSLVTVQHRDRPPSCSGLAFFFVGPPLGQDIVE